ncbi:MAG: NADH-quinone oxidoreductase subunit N [Pirellulales bacterium]
MNFQELLDHLIHDTLRVSLPGFMPELVLCATIVLMLLARLPAFGRRINTVWIALPGCLAALYFAAPWRLLPGLRESADFTAPIFTGMLVYDELTVFFRSLLLVFACLFLVFTRISGIPDREDSPDFYTLVLGGIVGMCLMASANHMVMVFLGVEMASVPSYALAGMLKGRRQSSEAALKYVVYGAGTAGVMLYGISLLAGALGSVHIPTMAMQLASLPAEALAERQTVLLMGGLMVMVGVAFKLSAVPFHFWCPDVFEGASAEVNAFLSVASKAAALALLARLALGFGFVGEPRTAQAPVAHSAAYRALEKRPLVVPQARDALPGSDAPDSDPDSNVPDSDAAPQNAVERLAPVRRFLVGLIGLLAAVTCTFGNLAAYNQTNMKRLLAYSTIAHAGYLMMPVAAAVALIGKDIELAEEAIASLAFYAGVYLFMNLGAFAIVAFLRNTIRSEEIADYGGLIHRSPGVAVALSLILFSLIGLPPLAGFPAKLFVFAYLVPAELLSLLVIGGLNTALSLFYYLRVVKVMTLDPEPAGRLPASFSMWSPAGIYVALITLPVIVLGVSFEPLNRWARLAADHLLS